MSVRRFFLCTIWQLFKNFVVMFCSKFEHFVSFSEIRHHNLTGLPYSNNSTSAGKLWSWRIQRRVKRRRLTFWRWSPHVWIGRVDKIKCFFVNFFADFKLNFWSPSTFQPWWDRPHSVRFRRLTRHSMRQDQSFPAQLKSKKCDTFESLWGDFSENWSKMCPQTAGVRIVPWRFRWTLFCLSFSF